MPGSSAERVPDRADEEIENGRLWRAKEILRGRLAGAGYDAALFLRIADVLARMHDDDEAGRFHVLAGTLEGRGGELARAFLARRSTRNFAQLWSQMPAAARRVGGEALPSGTIALLREAGHAPHRLSSHLAKLKSRSTSAKIPRKAAHTDRIAAIKGERIGLVVAAILLVILTLGLVSLMRLIWWGITSVFG